MTNSNAPGLQRASALSVTGALVAIYIIWGSTYLAIHFAIETLPPLLMAGVRFLIAGSILYVFMRLKGAPHPTRRQWMQAGLVGLLLLAGGNGTVTWVEQQVPSSIAALLVALVPMWMVVLDWARPHGNRPTLRVLLGVILGFGGVAVLAFRGGVGSSSAIHPIAFLLVASTAVWAGGSIYARYADLPTSPLMSTAVEMLAGGVALSALGLGTGEAGRLAGHMISTRSLVAMGFLVIFGSIVAYSAYTWLLRAASPAIVSTYAYVNPAVAVLLGVQFAGDALTTTEILAGLIIVGSVILITLPKRKTRAATNQMIEPSVTPGEPASIGEGA